MTQPSSEQQACGAMVQKVRPHLDGRVDRFPVQCGAPIRLRSGPCVEPMAIEGAPGTWVDCGGDEGYWSHDEPPADELFPGDYHGYDPGGYEHIRIVEGAPCAAERCDGVHTVNLEHPTLREAMYAHTRVETWEAYDPGHPAIPEEVSDASA